MFKWFLKKNNEIQASQLHDNPQDEYHFMLSQLNDIQRMIDNSKRRNDQVIAFCLTVWTALLAAVLSITSSTNFNGDFFFAVQGFALITASIFGLVTFAAFVSATTTSGISRGRYLILIEYFLNRFPDVRQYIDYRSNEDLANSWKENFRSGLVLFLHLFALGVSIMCSIGLTFILLHSLVFYKLQMTVITVIVTGIFFGVIPFSICELYIYRKRRKVKEDFASRLEVLKDKK